MEIVENVDAVCARDVMIGNAVASLCCQTL